MAASMMRPLAATSSPIRSMASGSTVRAGMYSASTTTGRAAGGSDDDVGAKSRAAGDGLRVLGTHLAAGQHILQEVAQGVVDVRLRLAWHATPYYLNQNTCFKGWRLGRGVD